MSHNFWHVAGSIVGYFGTDLFEFDWQVLVNEFVDHQVSTSNSDENFAVINLDVTSLGTELINTFTFSGEQTLESWSSGRPIDILSQCTIDGIRFNWDINVSKFHLSKFKLLDQV